MDQIRLLFTANAGVLLRLSRFYAAVDAFHNKRTPPFSPVPVELMGQFSQDGTLSELQAVIVSHCHPDHCTLREVRSAMEMAPNAVLLAPEQLMDRQILLTGPACHIHAGDVSMDFYRLRHDGLKYRAKALYGIVLESGGRRILMPGDCMDHADVERMTNGAQTDVAILNFPWITLPKNRLFVDNVLQPKHLVIFHLPSPGDDTEGFLPATLKMADRLKHVQDVRILTQPGQEEQL